LPKRPRGRRNNPAS